MPIIYLSPSTQDWNQYVTGSGSEEYNMNLLADALEPYLRSNGIQFQRNRPEMTAASSIREANSGYYDGLIFHRVIPGFMIQGGCPDGTGMGGPGYCIKGEFFFNGIKNDLKHKRGVLSMARSQSPNSAGSQFFLMHQDAKHLDGQYAAFGKVTSGMEVVDAIAATKTGRNDRPLEEQKIASITVERNGAALAELKKLPDPYGRF